MRLPARGVDGRVAELDELDLTLCRNLYELLSLVSKAHKRKLVAAEAALCFEKHRRLLRRLWWKKRGGGERGGGQTAMACAVPFIAWVQFIKLTSTSGKLLVSAAFVMSGTYGGASSRIVSHGIPLKKGCDLMSATPPAPVPRRLSFRHSSCRSRSLAFREERRYRP